MNAIPPNAPMSDATAVPARADLAVVGCGLRLPGNLSSLPDLWAILQRGGDGICDLPQGRWTNDL